MGDWDAWQLLLVGAGTLGAIALTAAGLALWQLRRRLAARRGGTASPKRLWHAESVDPVARLRSPYKAEPLCQRCVAVGVVGERPFYLCRLNEDCGLIEDEAVRRR